MTTADTSAGRLLRSRNFGPYFFGNAASATGAWFQNLASAVLIYRLTHSALLLGGELALAHARVLAQPVLADARFDGRVSGDLQAGGTLGAPVFSGLVRGDALSFDYPPYGIYLKNGDPYRVAVGDQILAETGDMNGPTNQAIQNDADSRMNRAALAPFTSDTYQSFHPGNPRIMILPLVDWTGISGSKPVPVKGFAAFWLDGSSGGKISGRFVRYTLTTTGGPSWDNDLVDPSTLGQGTFDGGVAIATLAQ